MSYFHKTLITKTPRIELRVNERTPRSGDREIWIDGQRWAHARAEPHGVHGPTYEISYSDRTRPAKWFTLGTDDPDKGYKETLRVRRHSYWQESTVLDPDDPEPYRQLFKDTALDRLLPLVALAYGDGWFKTPEQREAEAKAYDDERKARIAEDNDKRARMRAALRLAHRLIAGRTTRAPDDSWYSKGIVEAWEEIFSAPFSERDSVEEREDTRC